MREQLKKEIRQWLRHNEHALSAFVTGIYSLNKKLFSDAECIEETKNKVLLSMNLC